jgi:hypothetical protein
VAALNDDLRLVVGEESSEYRPHTHWYSKSRRHWLNGVGAGVSPEIRGWTTSELTKSLPSGQRAIHMEGPVTRSFHPVSMPTDDSSLGQCPDCGERISDAWLLVEYSRDDGTDGVWAECPSCEDVVAPE